MPSVLKEYCAENLEFVPAAIRAGASRVELCDNLAVGGTSPSYGVIRRAVVFSHKTNVGIMAMCRPRGGDFIYCDYEREALVDDVRCARSLGVTGVVLGCLRWGSTGSLTLDEELVCRLVDEAKGLGRGMTAHSQPVQVTFHMAFDALDKEEQFRAIDTLARIGVERILTHGGPAGTTIERNLSHLQSLVSHANGRIIILPGGGVTWENAQTIATELGVSEVHGTKVVRI